MHIGAALGNKKHTVSLQAAVKKQHKPKDRLYTLDIYTYPVYLVDMNTVNALKIRNRFGEVLDMLDREKEPILITKSKKIRAVLICYEDFQTRFLDKQAEEKKENFLKQVESHTATSLVPEDSVDVLRKLRGYTD